MMWIKSTMERHPSVAKGFVSGLLLSVADAVSQLGIEKNQFNWKRNIEFMGLGLGWLAPCIEIWYSHLLPRITTRYLSHMSKPKRVIYRLIIDTLVFAPVTYTGFYFVKDVLLKPKRDFSNLKDQIYEKFIPTLVADWIIWAPVNFVNFWWVPIHMQGLYVGVFSFFFNVLLSYIANKELEQQKAQKQKQIEEIPLALITKQNNFKQNIQPRLSHQVTHHRHHQSLEHLKDVIVEHAHAKNIQIIL